MSLVLVYSRPVSPLHVGNRMDRLLLPFSRRNLRPEPHQPALHGIGAESPADFIHRHVHLPLFSAVCFLVSAGCFIAYFLLVPQDGYVLMANSIYGNPFLFVFISLIGSVMVISFSMLLQCVKQDQKLLPYIGRNTLGIFILHKPVVELLRKVVTKLHFDYNHPVCLFVIPVVTLCVVLPVLYVIQRYAPFLFGKTDFERKKEV